MSGSLQTLPPIRAAEHIARNIVVGSGMEIALPDPHLEPSRSERQAWLLREAGRVLVDRQRLIGSVHHFAGGLLPSGVSGEVDRAHRVAIARHNRAIEAIMVLHGCERSPEPGFSEHHAAYAGRDILSPGLLHQLRRPVPGHALDTWQKVMALIARTHPMTWVDRWWQWEPKPGSFT